MHDHRIKLDDTCTMCHGKIEFGREGGGFCSNPACHGRSWPAVNLNVDFKSPQAVVPAEPAAKTEPVKAAPAKAAPSKAAPTKSSK